LLYVLVLIALTVAHHFDCLAIGGWEKIAALGGTRLGRLTTKSVLVLALR